jgi:carboxyl-terminal processing protease
MQRLRIGAIACAAVAALVLLSSPGGYAHAEQPASIQSQRDRESADLGKLYDSVVETIEKNFYDEGLLKRLDWSGRAAAVRPSVVSAPTNAEAIRRINALLGELNTSHTALFSPDDYQYYILLDIVGAGANGFGLMARKFWGNGPYYPGIGAFTREIDGRHFVDGVLEGSPAARAGLTYGDEIISVDGKPYTPVAAFRGKIGTSVALSVRREANAQPQELGVDVVAIRPTNAFSAATENSARVIERNGSRVGYIHIWASHESDSVKKALARIDPGFSDEEERRRGRRGARAGDAARDAPKPLDFLIVDMRGRVGGSMDVAGQILDLVDSRQKPYWGGTRIMGRNGERNFDSQRAASFRGRSALLTNENTRSAAEIVAHGYKRSGFGPVIGTPSAGAVSSGRTFAMPGDLLLYVAVSGLEFDGKPLEGAGVAPDQRVERPLPYAAGADPVLDAAVNKLAGAAKPTQ